MDEAENAMRAAELEALMRPDDMDENEFAAAQAEEEAMETEQGLEGSEDEESALGPARSLATRMVGFNTAGHESLVVFNPRPPSPSVYSRRASTTFGREYCTW